MQRWVTITNDQMFKHVFGRDRELCRRLIELALEERISSVEFTEAQHESKDIGRNGGTYFDVLAVTGQGDLIVVEMQKTRQPGILHRARVYQGRLTAEAWSRYVEDDGDYDYSKLPRCAVIFVCDFDPFGVGMRRYTGKMRYESAAGVVTDATGKPVDDGAVVVMLNSKGSEGNIPPDLAAFLDYMASREFVPGRSGFVDDVERRVVAANSSELFQEGLMNMDEKLWWSKREGIEQGEKRGRAEVARLVERMIADGRQADLPGVLTDPEALDRELGRYGIRPQTE